MDIANIISSEYVEFAPDTRVAKLVGVFEDPTVRGILVRGDAFEGVVTRRQLATSHHPPAEKLGSVAWSVPHLAPDEDVRDVAGLMVESGSHVLPVFEEGELLGVVTVDDLLHEVQPFLDAVTVEQACTRDLVTVNPESTVGEALHQFRENRITHLPVVEDETAVGIVSLYDVIGITTRATSQAEGGDMSGTDAFGGDRSKSAGRARGGGFGAREGERARMLDLPVRDVMVSPVRTIDPEETLDAAVEEMTATDGSSLVVTESGHPFGIVTTTDVLDALTWEASGNRAVEVYGTDLLDDISYDEIVAMVDAFDDHDHGMAVLGAKVHLHEHDETRRGTPLLLARVRLHTDRGLFVASGEGYGASHALNEARDLLERQIRDQKTHAKTKKHPGEAFWEKRFGWLLEG